MRADQLIGKNLNVSKAEVDALTGYIDIYPTLQRIAGSNAKPPNPLDGRDMLDVIRGEAESEPREWYSYIAQGRPDQIALFDGTWKLVVTKGSVFDATPDKKTPLIELFRLDTDPAEKNDVSFQHKKRTARMLESLRNHRRLKIPGIPDFMEGRQGFVAPENWTIRD